jgi:DNA-binding IscR family transcriptional regulator
VFFTTKAEYGVRLLIQLGLQGGGAPVSLKAVAEAEGLPLAYLERIAALLKKAELVAFAAADPAASPSLPLEIHG